MQNQKSGELFISLEGGYFDETEFPKFFNEIFTMAERTKMANAIDKLRAQNERSLELNRDLPQSYLNNVNKLSKAIETRLEKNGYKITNSEGDDDTIFIEYTM